METIKGIEYVAVSTRIRLARNLEGYPFPNKLKDVKSARKIESLLYEALKGTEQFELFPLNDMTKEEDIQYYKERNLISQTLIDNKRFSAAIISQDETISVMINEEDHVREQYFVKGFNLPAAYELISGIDDIIGKSVSFSYDESLGYLTACPTNLGTGLRASVMLFLPALTRRKRMKELQTALLEKGLTVRGAFGEGSGTEGELYQISNEVTLGKTESEILFTVKEQVLNIIAMELLERDKLIEESAVEIVDTVLRSYGVLTNCYVLGAKDFMTHMANIKLGVALDIFDGDMEKLNDLIVQMRSANLTRFQSELSPKERDILRAKDVASELKQMQLWSEEKRWQLFQK